MTSLGNHHIRSLIFQLSIPDRENAKNIQDRFSAFAEAEIPQLMEQVLDKYDRPGQVIRMDRLEIDLGDIQTKDRDHGMREEFFRQLERALHDRLKSGSIENGGVSIAKVQTTLMEQLEHFLLFGYLPWQGDPGDFSSLDELILQFLEDSPNAFRFMLERIIPVKKARFRFISNVAPHTLLRILRAFSSLDPADIEPLTAALEWLYEKMVAESGRQLPGGERFFAYENLFQIFFHPPVFSGNTLSELFTYWSLNRPLPFKPLLSLSPAQRERFMEILFPQRAKTLPPPDFPLEQKALWPLMVQAVETVMKSSPNGVIGIDAPGLVKSIIGDHRRPAAKERIDETKRPALKTTHLFIRNSGLVILWPYLPAFFKSFGLLADDRFISRRYRNDAVHYLQLLITGEKGQMEFDLGLNKVLCGMRLEDPLEPDFQPVQGAYAESKKLIESAVKNWAIIKNTSPEGFCNSFLLREGRLTLSDEGVTLVIDRRGYDVLLDQLPYTIRVVKLPWMKKPLYVEW